MLLVRATAVNVGTGIFFFFFFFTYFLEFRKSLGIIMHCLQACLVTLTCHIDNLRRYVHLEGNSFSRRVEGYLLIVRMYFPFYHLRVW